MKMASFSTTALFLLCCSIIISEGSSDTCDIKAVTGDTVTVPLKVKLEPNWKLTLKLRDKIIFTQVRGTKPSNKDGVSLEGGSLILKNLKSSDAGPYKYEVFDGDRKSKGEIIQHVCVSDPVAKPTVEAKCNGEKVGFTCNFQGSLSHQWFQNDNKMKVEDKSFELPAIDVKADRIYCSVSNKVSSERSDDVSAASIKKCIPSSVIPGLPDEVFGLSIWIFIGGGGGIVLMLILIVIVCCVRARRRKRMLLKDEEELRLGWSNPQQQRFQHSLPPPPDQQLPYHHQQQQQQQRRQQQPADHACHQGNAGHTGPRQNRSKQQRPRAPEPTTNQPQPSPRRAAQVPKAVNGDDGEQPPPLPQPRKKRS